MAKQKLHSSLVRGCCMPSAASLRCASHLHLYCIQTLLLPGSLQLREWAMLLSYHMRCNPRSAAAARCTQVHHFVKTKCQCLLLIGRHRCLKVLWAEAENAESSCSAAESQQSVACKDANDVLVQRGAQAVQQCIEQAKALPETVFYRWDALPGLPSYCHCPSCCPVAFPV